MLMLLPIYFGLGFVAGVAAAIAFLGWSDTL